MPTANVKTKTENTEHRTASLRGPVTFSTNDLQVDEKAGIIKNASAMSIGSAKGHGFDIDAITLTQLVALINAEPLGLKCRLTHPRADDDGYQEDDDILTNVARVKNARLDGDSVKVDVHLAEYASILPGLGDVRTFLLKKAKEDPTSFGLSAVIGFDVEPVLDDDGNPISLPARLLGCMAVDLVGDPAANRNGLLSARNPTGASIETSIGDRTVALTASTVDEVLRLKAALNNSNPPGWQDPKPAEPNSKKTSGVSPGVVPPVHTTGEHPMDESLKSALIKMGAPPKSTDAELSAYHGAMSAEDKAKCAKLVAGELPEDPQHNRKPVDEPAPAAEDGDYLKAGDSSDDDEDDDDDDEDDDVVEDADDDDDDLDDDTVKTIGRAVAHGIKAYKGLSAKGKKAARLAARRDAKRATDLPAATVRRLSRRAGAGRITPPVVNEGDRLIALERRRVENITSLGTMLKVPEHVVREQIASGEELPKVRIAMLAAVARENGAIHPDIRVGNDSRYAALSSAIPQAILLRANPDADVEKLEAYEKRVALASRPGINAPGKIHEMAHQLKGMTMCGMFRAYLMALGCDNVPDSPHALRDLMGHKAMCRRFPKIAALAESTSDFGQLTLDAMNKSLRFIYQDAPRTWVKWAQRGTAPDFKSIHRVALSDAPTLVKRAAGQEIQYVQLTDGGETFVLSEYGAGIRLTRQVIINDDLSAFSSIARLQANSSARLEDDLAYAAITLNAAMADTGTLFSTTAYSVNKQTLKPNGGHQNQITGPYPVGLVGLNAAKSLMKKQKGPQAAARLELAPKFLLCPTSIEAIAEQAILSEKLIAVNSSASVSSTQINQGEHNPFFKKLEVIGSTRLDDDNSLNWYLATDYRLGQVATVEVDFLSDEPEPVAKQETDFDTDDVKYYVRHTAAAAPLDWRGFVKVIGA